LSHSFFYSSCQGSACRAAALGCFSLPTLPASPFYSFSPSSHMAASPPHASRFLILKAAHTQQALSVTQFSSSPLCKAFLLTSYLLFAILMTWLILAPHSILFLRPIHHFSLCIRPSRPFHSVIFSLSASSSEKERQRASKDPFIPPSLPPSLPPSFPSPPHTNWP
jgi:hypothetical protein